MRLYLQSAAQRLRARTRLAVPQLYSYGRHFVATTAGESKWLATADADTVTSRKRSFTTNTKNAGPSAISNTSSNTDEPMEWHRLYEYLELKTFTPEELRQVFDKMTAAEDDQPTTTNSLGQAQLSEFLFQRIQAIEVDQYANHTTTSTTGGTNVGTDTITDHEKRQYAQEEAVRFWKAFHNNNHQQDSATTTIITKQHFVDTLTDSATSVDMKRMWPITLSILLVGTSVGITTPAMPFVVEKIGLTPGQYGTVVSAFALAKMAGNIPSAVLVERHGRKVRKLYCIVLYC